jgi:sugar/nucleoside kinase (ribokinase family)
MISAIDYLVLGYLTRDLLPDGQTTGGGTALYAATTAQRLGRQAGIFSAALPDEVRIPGDVALALTPSTVTSTFSHRYQNGKRQQLVQQIAAPLDLLYLPQAWRDAPVVHLGPVLGECDESLVFAFPNALLGVTPQGWLRSVGSPLPAPMEARRWQPNPPLLRRIDLLVLSSEDVDGDTNLIAYYAAHCPLVALTHGARGATIFVAGAAHDISALPVFERDPNGAGDVFAAAMLLRYAEGAEPLAAAAFAAAAAALAVEHFATEGIPSRERVNALLAQHS